VAENATIDRVVAAVRKHAGLDRLYQARPAAEVSKSLGIGPEEIDIRSPHKIPKFGDAVLLTEETVQIAPADIARVLASAQTYLTLVTDTTPKDPTDVPPASFITTWWGATFQYNGYINGKSGYWYLAPGEAATPGTPQSSITTPVTASISGPVTSQNQAFNGTSWVNQQADASGFLQMSIAAQAIAQLTTDIGAGNAYAKEAQLPASLVGGAFNIRTLSSSDVPGRSWNLSASDVPAPTGGDLTSGNAITKTKPLGTTTGKDVLTAQAIPDTTPESVLQAGATTYNIGVRVFFSLALAGVPTSSDGVTYVAIKGATSGTYYAVAVIGAAVQGYFDMPTSEKLNFVSQGGSSGHWAIGSVYGMSP
jgi:hypothetical protein